MAGLDVRREAGLRSDDLQLVQAEVVGHRERLLRAAGGGLFLFGQSVRRLVRSRRA